MNDSAALEMLAYHEYAPRFVLAESPLLKFFNGLAALEMRMYVKYAPIRL